MFFSNYKKYQNTKIRSSLLWEYDIEKIDYESMKSVIIQRVVERGRISDFYAILNRYGLENVKNSVKNIKSLDKKDIAFLSCVFNINKKEFRCYSKKQ